MKEALLETNLPLKLIKRGKVRDIYELENGQLLVVATDRISAFDVTMVQGIPGKGKVLNQISTLFFNFLTEWKSWKIKHHFISTEISNFLGEKITVWEQWAKENDLEERSMIVKKADKVIPVECVVRGYLAGSAWKEYCLTGKVNKIKLPSDLVQGDKLSQPIFTPAIKVEDGHDENVNVEKLIEILAKWTWTNGQILGKTAAGELVEFLIKASINLYVLGSAITSSRGIIIADSKFEFGLIENQIILIDEIFTPDSSRFWLKQKWQPGKSHEAYDKQLLRDWLEKSGWDKKSLPPDLPEGLVKKIAKRYEIIRKLLLETKRKEKD